MQFHEKELEKLNIRVLAGVRERDEDGDVVKTIDLAIPDARLNIEVDGRHHLTSSRQIRRPGACHVPFEYLA